MSSSPLEPESSLPTRIKSSRNLANGTVLSHANVKIQLILVLSSHSGSLWKFREPIDRVPWTTVIDLGRHLNAPSCCLVRRRVQCHSHRVATRPKRVRLFRLKPDLELGPANFPINLDPGLAGPLFSLFRFIQPSPWLPTSEERCPTPFARDPSQRPVRGLPTGNDVGRSAPGQDAKPFSATSKSGDRGLTVMECCSGALLFARFTK